MVLGESPRERRASRCRCEAEGRPTARDDRHASGHAESACSEGTTANPREARARQRGSAQPGHGLAGQKRRDEGRGEPGDAAHGDGGRDNPCPYHSPLGDCARKHTLIRRLGPAQSSQHCRVDNVLFVHESLVAPVHGETQFLLHAVRIEAPQHLGDVQAADCPVLALPDRTQLPVGAGGVAEVVSSVLVIGEASAAFPRAGELLLPLAMLGLLRPLAVVLAPRED